MPRGPAGEAPRWQETCVEGPRGLCFLYRHWWRRERHPGWRAADWRRDLAEEGCRTWWRVVWTNGAWVEGAGGRIVSVLREEGREDESPSGPWRSVWWGTYAGTCRGRGPDAWGGNAWRDSHEVPVVLHDTARSVGGRREATRGVVRRWSSRGPCERRATRDARQWRGCRRRNFCSFWRRISRRNSWGHGRARTTGGRTQVRRREDRRVGSSG